MTTKHGDKMTKQTKMAQENQQEMTEEKAQE
jgi:hypothetical protein